RKLGLESAPPDPGIFDAGRSLDVSVEYAKGAPDDILIRITIANRGPDPAKVAVLPTLWFRNTWTWGRTGEGYWRKPGISAADSGTLLAEHESLGRFFLAVEGNPSFLFTETATNADRLFNSPNSEPHVKDAFHEYLVHGRADAVSPTPEGTKAAALYRLEIPAGGETTLQLRLYSEECVPAEPFGAGFDGGFNERSSEADGVYAVRPAP